MTDTFIRLIPDAQDFYAKLSKTNTRDWWLEHKPIYEASLKAPATLLLDIVAGELGADTGQSLTPKLFRPNRDVRFSKDKSPYNTYLHMLWTVGRGRQPGYFFGISPTYVRVGAGLMGFAKDTLVAYRARAAEGRVADVVSPLLTQGYTIDDPALKRVPSPSDKDDPNGLWLRRKGLTLWADFDPTEAGLVQDLLGRFRTLAPMNDFLADL